MGEVLFFAVLFICSTSASAIEPSSINSSNGSSQQLEGDDRGALKGRKVKAYAPTPNIQNLTGGIDEEKLPGELPNAGQDALNPVLKWQSSSFEPHLNPPPDPPPARNDSIGTSDIRSSSPDSSNPETSYSATSESGDRAVKRNIPPQAQLALQISRLSLASGDLAAADKAATETLRYDARNADALALRAEIANLRGDYPKAEELARSAVEMGPSVAGYQNLALAELREGKLDNALEDSTRAVELNPKSALSHAIRGQVQGALGNHPAELAELQNAADRDPRFADASTTGDKTKAIIDQNGKDASLLATLLGRRIPSSDSIPGFWVVVGLLLVAVSSFAGFFFFRARAQKWGLQQGPAAPSVANAAPLSKPSDHRVGKYELGRVIGRGGMGIVYEARDPDLARAVAVKKMSPEIAADQPARDAYIKEARIVASLRHPAIVEIYDIVPQDENIYLIFEFVRGITAHQLLQDQGPLALERATDILRPICHALGYAHSRNFVHRDLKPMNVMVTEEGPAKLMDFGIARVLSGQRDHTRTQTVRGTPVYMAPESWEGIVRTESDIYSLGVSLYEMVTGELPFASSPIRIGDKFEPPSRVAGLPTALDELLVRALEPNPDRRIRSAFDFLRRLEAAVTSQSKTPV